MTGTIEVTDVSKPGSPVKMFRAVAIIDGDEYTQVLEYALDPFLAAARAAATALRTFEEMEAL